MSEPQPWTRIFNRIKVQIPSAPDALIRQQLFNVLIDFTQDTNTWIEEVPLAIQPNVTSYAFTVHGGSPYRLMLVYNSNVQSPGDRYRWADGNISMRVPGILTLYNQPKDTVNWIAVVAKAVSTDALDGTGQPTGYPEVDDWIVGQFNDAIVSGALAMLRAMPAKPFSDPKTAAMNEAFYRSQKSQARVNNLRANVFGAQVWTYPQAFSVITRKGWA